MSDDTTNTVVITVRPGANDAPVADAGADQMVDEGDVVTLDGVGSDPENEMLVYGWRQISGSHGVVARRRSAQHDVCGAGAVG